MAETFKLLNKNLNFVPTQTNFSKSMLNEEFEDFYRSIKLKGHFKNAENKDRFSEETYSENLQTKPGYQTTITIETFLEATRNEINNEIKKTK